jgi:pteridine reductase
MKIIKNKKVLITGSAVRIGCQISRFLAYKSFDVIIHCNNSIIEAEILLEEFKKNTDGNHSIAQGNLLDLEFQKSLFNEKIDVLINNASCFCNKALSEEKLEDAKKQFDINFWIPYNLMNLFKNQKLEEGVIINILDSYISKVNTVSGAYLLSKKSLGELTKFAALQWAPDIRVNGIAPGFVIPPVGMEESKMIKSIEKTPLKKAVNPLDIAETCLFIINNKSITGEIINIDGGVHI